MKKNQRIVILHGFSSEIFQVITTGIRELLPHGEQPVLAAAAHKYLSVKLEQLILDLLGRGTTEIHEEERVVPEKQVVFIHGYDRKGLFALIDGIKPLLPDRRAAAFCTSTPNNLTMTLGEIIHEVHKDHATMKKRS